MTALIFSLLGARLMAADPAPTTNAVEQQFQQVDVLLAIEAYKKFRMAALELAFKLQTEDATLCEEERNRLINKHRKLQQGAEELRASTIDKAAAAIIKTR